MPKAEDGNSFTPRILAQSAAHSTITAPTDLIDISKWVFTVDEWDYNACTPKSKSHISAGFTHSPEGKKMSINVEYVAGVLMVEHYIEDITEKLHCRVQSVTTLLIDKDFTTAHVIWELIAEHKSGDEHTFTNNVWVHTTPEYDHYMESKGLPYEEVKKQFQTGVEAHNHEETPNFAASIQRMALKK
ncbi:MAG: hypothetical protein WDN23_02140 [Edaphobacter sp.]